VSKSKLDIVGFVEEVTDEGKKDSISFSSCSGSATVRSEIVSGPVVGSTAETLCLKEPTR
jgi:hypothetical protein